VRVVLDTNVVVSGIFWKGPPHDILQAWKRDWLRLVVSADILVEYQRVANELLSIFPEVDLSPVLNLLMVHSEICRPIATKISICRDRDDEKFLLCAVSAAVDAVVSGDKDLLVLKEINGIPIVSPRTFVNRFLKH
jgi:putative PIN family toxin of toxin-antitoxin system